MAAGACIDGGIVLAERAGETDQRLHAVAAWREAPYFTAAGRVALALSEVMARLSDRADPVPDEVWNTAAKHFPNARLQL